MKKNDEPIIIEQIFDAAIDKVWGAITEIDQMRQWFFDNIPEFKSELGFKTQFNVVSGERNFLHKWKITEVVPFEKITINWKFDVYPGEAFVIFELSKQNGSTRLTLTNTVIEDFPDDIPEFTRESCIAGWEFFIQNNLKEYLERTA
ncbi:MAG: SRPBCC domain-containing protein [Candidatus Zixiibacteriota bacterium]